MEVLIKQQVILSGLIERIWTNLLKLGQARMTPAELVTRRERLDDYWSRFQNQHFQISSYDEVGETEYFTKDLFTSTEDSYFYMRSKILTALESLKKEKEDVSGSSAMPLVKQMQLPKISLPKFSGDQLAWESFRDLFRSLVHEVKEMPDVQKLQYLKSCLSGEALDVIANIPLTDAAYQGAWHDLLTRYDNQRVLLYTHLRNLLACPVAGKASQTEIKRLLGVFTHSIRAFAALKRPVESWDDWFVHLLVSKLDSNTRLHWETSLADACAFPTFTQLQDYLENRMRALEAARPEAATPHATALNLRGSRASRVSSNTATTSKFRASCPLCQGLHAMQYCHKFKAMVTAQRHEQVRKASGCFNCLRSGHSANSCPSAGRCLVCGEKHHTMLHGTPSRMRGSSAGEDVQPAAVSSAPSATVLRSSISSTASGAGSPILLATARVILESETGRAVEVRALLDSGSEASFVSEWVAQTLAARRKRVNVAVAGLQGTQTGTVSSSVAVTLRSRHSPDLRLNTEALVLRTLTNLLPANRVSGAQWPHIKGLQLADPAFDVPARVDAILGADVFSRVMEPAICRGAPGTPTGQLTAFGWVLTGPLTGDDSVSVSAHRISVFHAQPLDGLSTQLQRFWEMEEVGDARLPTPEETLAETHYQETHSRDRAGRYVVRLPCRKDSLSALGASRSAALSMLLSSERRLDKRPELRRRYVDFMNDYLALEHMEPVPPGLAVPSEGCYLPHHAVFKSGDSTGKIRVVFNASFRTTSGLSLNDCLMPGPKLQPDLWLILTRWRFFRIGFITDIVKMFRQIRIHPEDADLQRVIWRAEPCEEVHDFRLMTVTYGTAPAPFLALRTLQQLAWDEASRFPLGAKTLLEHSYVDDILAGSDDLERAREIRDQLSALLRAGGFALSGWASNEAELCPLTEERRLPAVDAVTALGTVWDPATDTLWLRVAVAPAHGTVTKRRALSEVARLFDPLGWVAPVLVFGKIFIQDLWLSGCNWDEPLTEELSGKWARFRSDLQQLDAVKFPRWLRTSPSSQLMELHGFSDASERAYAAVVYIRVVEASGQISTHLLTARTKVAPVKTQSVPRLELCGAVLLARLLNRVAAGLALTSIPVYAWTDARVVLNWLHSHASRWKPFVANRVAEVQTLLPGDNWRYVRTVSNPADVATRGVSPAELQGADLWWYGPDWLRRPQAEWPDREAARIADLPEEERRSCHHGSSTSDRDEFLERFSTLSRLVRVTAYCYRFLHNARSGNPRRGGFLTSAEQAESLMIWVRVVQHRSFSAELKALGRGRTVPVGSPLKTLRPMRDGSGLLRVGGRIQAASLSYSECHPLVLPKEGHFSLLLVRDAHLATLHGGPQLTRSHLLRRFWILGGASLVRKVVRACVRCARFRAGVGRQQMGQLPPERLRPAKPFTSVGLDYAGPFRIRSHRGRGHAASKGYICLFVCLVTRAIHLEAVSDLTAPAFLAAFRRFVARRGSCRLLLSDNATNFRGADAELRAMFRKASDFYNETGMGLADNGTEWRFIPPRAPHFGGLWEAGIRSTKHHLRRIVGDHALTYEELATLLCQIEACLNSRPLYPLSSDPTDLVALTPGHFLVGEALAGVSEPPSREDNLHALPRWRLVSAMRDSFWRRWTKEYLHHLQQLFKWTERRSNLKPGALVLVRDELLPPTRWALGRVTEVFPGPDGLVRVASVRTATTELRRPIVKLCPLPIPPASDDSAKIDEP